MYHRSIKTMLAAVVLIIFASLSHAETTAPAKTSADHQKSSAKSIKKASAQKSKTAAKVKLIDINSADKAALAKLPGISDAYADKIIAGRPYGSKAQLMTRNILPAGNYEGISRWIVAKQPYKDAAKNAEYLKKKK